MKEKLVVILDPSYSGFNKGDDVIAQAVNQEIRKLANDRVFITRFSTKQGFPFARWNTTKKVNHFFIAGSNMMSMRTNPFFGSGRFAASFKDLFFLWNKVVTCGVGWNSEKRKSNFAGTFFYKKILNKDVKHSVRDGYTKIKLNENGFDGVINTGCPSMWGFTSEHLSKIPVDKQKSVVFTLTPGKSDIQNDNILIQKLRIAYDKVFFFPQTYGCYEYLTRFDHEGVVVLPPDLACYDKLLIEEEIDYIGTRLHGGIRAIQHHRRTIIIEVDHRAREISKDTGLTILSREDIGNLPEFCNQQIETKIRIPFDAIESWRDDIRKILC